MTFQRAVWTFALLLMALNISACGSEARKNNPPAAKQDAAKPTPDTASGQQAPPANQNPPATSKSTPAATPTPAPASTSNTAPTPTPAPTPIPAPVPAPVVKQDAPIKKEVADFDVKAFNVAELSADLKKVLNDKSLGLLEGKAVDETKANAALLDPNATKDLAWCRVSTTADLQKDMIIPVTSKTASTVTNLGLRDVTFLGEKKDANLSLTVVCRTKLDLTLAAMRSAFVGNILMCSNAQGNCQVRINTFSGTLNFDNTNSFKNLFSSGANKTGASYKVTLTDGKVSDETVTEQDLDSMIKSKQATLGCTIISPDFAGGLNSHDALKFVSWRPAFNPPGAVYTFEEPSSRQKVDVNCRGVNTPTTAEGIQHALGDIFLEVE